MVMMISVLRSIGVVLLSTLFIIHTNHHHCNGAPILPSRTAATSSRISSSSSPSSSLPPVPCTPSATRICVSFDASSTPGRYMVNTGSGAKANGDLTFAAGTSYTFQMTGNKFGTFPFALTTSSTRATTPLTDGVSGRNPASMDGDQLIYTPSSIGPQKVYYQSVLASNLGGAINIVNACNPSPTRVCVYYDESSGSYATNYGPSPLGYGMEAKGDVVLNAGTKYDFQVVGASFANNPLALSTMDGSAANEEMRYTLGVSGSMPAMSDGQTFSFTPSAKGPSTLYYESTMNKGIGGRINIVGACQPSLADHHICVSTNGRTYSIDIGDGQGDQSQRDLVLEAGTPYTLEMVSLPGVSESHPFALCNSPKGPCEAPLTDGVTGDNPLASDGMIMTFIPEDHGPTTIYYQSQSDSGMGGKITITNSCNPSETNICVHNDGISYSVDQGFGPMAHGDLTLISGVPYTFEMMGSKFKDFPFAFTTEHGTSVKATTMMTDGVSGTSPATMDDQKLIYTPAAKGFTQLRYESTTAPGMGGSITIAGVCNPSRHHICVTMTDDGNYALNNGNGAISNAGLILNAGTKYVFQAQGDAFSEHPFALTAVSSPSSMSTSSYQGSVAFQPLVDGVDPNSDNPLSGDGQQLVYTPLVVGPSNIFYQSPSSTTKGGRIHIQGACQPNDNRICVTQTDSHDGSGTPVYAVNMGTDDTATRRGPLVLKAGEKYTFEMTGVGSAFTRNPFALTLSPNQATEIITSNITSNNPLVGDDETLVYTPSSQGPATIYYQSTATPNMGGTITIANACNPSHTNICVYQDSVTGIPSPYWIDQGDGKVKQGTIVMYTGTEYTLEAVGNGFATRPLAITQSSMKATTPLTKNLYGDNPLSKDDDKLLFIPDDSTPPSLYYQSLLYSNLGGPITIKQGPAPYTPLTSTQAIEAADAKVTTMAAPPVVIMNTTSDTSEGSDDEPVVVDDTKLNPKITHGGDGTSTIDTLEPMNEGGTVDENGHSTGILTDIDTMITAVNVSKMIHNKNYTMPSSDDNMSTNSSSSHASRPRIKPSSSLYSSTGGVIIDDSSMTYMDHSSHTGNDMSNSNSSAMDDKNNNMKISSTSTDDHTTIVIPPVTLHSHDHDDDTATGNNGNITEVPQQRRNHAYGIASSLPSMISASLLLLADTALALVVSLL